VDNGVVNMTRINGPQQLHRVTDSKLVHSKSGDNNKQQLIHMANRHSGLRLLLATKVATAKVATASKPAMVSKVLTMVQPTAVSKPVQAKMPALVVHNSTGHQASKPSSVPTAVLPITNRQPKHMPNTALPRVPLPVINSCQSRNQLQQSFRTSHSQSR
jgi:hypothetical protein